MRDEKTEQYLSDNGYQFEFTEAFPLEDLDIDAARANRSRLDIAIDLERVESYGNAMKRGTRFPPIVVADIPNHPYQLITGLHRIGGAKHAELAELSAYIVHQPDSMQRDLLELAINSIEGAAPDHRRKLLLATNFIERYAAQKPVLEEVAARFNVKPEQIRSHMRRDKHFRRARQMDVGALFESDAMFTNTLRDHIGSIRDPAVFKECILTIWHTRTKGEAAETLVRTIKQTPEREQLGVLRAHRAAFEAGTKNKIVRTPQKVASRYMTEARRLLMFLRPPYDGDVARLHLAGLDAKLPTERATLAKVFEMMKTVLEEMDLIIQGAKMPPPTKEHSDARRPVAH